MMITVVLATGNPGKVRELSRLLSGLDVELVGVKDVLGQALEVPELGDSFESNAVEKARRVCAATGLVSVADDSGLEVLALGGRPGVRSARFAHERATDAENNAALLAALEEEVDRRARFVCVLALATPWAEQVVTVRGVCDGKIARGVSGSGGFGYDPLFVVERADGKTMAELSAEEKDALSHRGLAVRALAAELERLLARQRHEAENIAFLR